MMSLEGDSLRKIILQSPGQVTALDHYHDLKPFFPQQQLNIGNRFVPIFSSLIPSYLSQPYNMRYSSCNPKRRIFRLGFLFGNFNIIREGQSVHYKLPPHFSSQASQSHTNIVTVPIAAVSNQPKQNLIKMQRCFGLARLSKNCVNKTSTILFKRANSSITESYTRNGFVDQVLPVRLP